MSNPWDFLEELPPDSDLPPPPPQPQSKHARNASLSLVSVRQGDSDLLGIENEDGSITILRTKSTLSTDSDDLAASPPSRSPYTFIPSPQPSSSGQSQPKAPQSSLSSSISKSTQARSPADFLKKSTNTNNNPTSGPRAPPAPSPLHPSQSPLPQATRSLDVHYALPSSAHKECTSTRSLPRAQQQHSLPSPSNNGAQPNFEAFSFVPEVETELAPPPPPQRNQPSLQSPSPHQPIPTPFSFDPPTPSSGSDPDAIRTAIQQYNSLIDDTDSDAEVPPPTTPRHQNPPAAQTADYSTRSNLNNEIQHGSLIDDSPLSASLPPPPIPAIPSLPQNISGHHSIDLASNQHTSHTSQTQSTQSSFKYEDLISVVDSDFESLPPPPAPKQQEQEQEPPEQPDDPASNLPSSYSFQQLPPPPLPPAVYDSLAPPPTAVFRGPSSSTSSTHSSIPPPPSEPQPSSTTSATAAPTTAPMKKIRAPPTLTAKGYETKRITHADLEESQRQHATSNPDIVPTPPIDHSRPSEPVSTPLPALEEGKRFHGQVDLPPPIDIAPLAYETTPSGSFTVPSTPPNRPSRPSAFSIVTPTRTVRLSEQFTPTLPPPPSPGQQEQQLSTSPGMFSPSKSPNTVFTFNSPPPSSAALLDPAQPPPPPGPPTFSPTVSKASSSYPPPPPSTTSGDDQLSSLPPPPPLSHRLSVSTRVGDTSAFFNRTKTVTSPTVSTSSIPPPPLSTNTSGAFSNFSTSSSPALSSPKPLADLTSVGKLKVHGTPTATGPPPIQEVRRIAHFSFDPTTGEYSDVPPEWRFELMKKFGIPLPLCATSLIDGYPGRIPPILPFLKQILLEKGGLNQIGIFRLAPEAFEVQNIKAELNNGTYKDCDDVNVIAHLIKVWFRELPVSLLDYVKDKNKFLNCADTPAAVGAFIAAEYEEPQLSLWYWLLDLCADIADLQDVNKMGIPNVAIVFSPNLYTPPDASKSGADAMRLCKRYTTFVEKAILWRISQVSKENRPVGY